MRVLLHGCNGRMGQVMTRVVSGTPDVRIVCGVDADVGKVRNDYPVYASLDAATEQVDVLIDFSHPAALDSILNFGVSRKVPMVICTTGFSAEDRRKMMEASATVPILNSSNMSVGVHAIRHLIRQAAAMLADGFDIEIVEKHHNQKLDSPSGTALMLAETLNAALNGSMKFVYGRHSRAERRQRNEIGIHAVRGGSIVGEHTVIFAGQGEVVEITHTAISREVFAYGALRAARFLVGAAPGFYGMEDVLGSGRPD